jgi:ABC-type multidrug transport system fused ATPase/permease subunit
MEDFTNNTGQNTGQPLRDPSRQTSGQNLGIAALITAIVTFVIAVIPCVGIIAMIPGIIAIVLASVGLSQASRKDSPRGVLIAGLIIAVVAILISFFQIFVAGKIGDKFESKWGKDIENVINDVQENVIDQLEDVNVNIKVQSDGDTVEINTNADKTNRHQELEELEKANTGSNDTLEKKK